MTPQLSAFVAAGRASELAAAARRAHQDVDEPAETPAARHPGWLVRLRAARLWQQECPEHQL
ncbi:MAG TPA: hypothetical protein VGN29_19950 [Solirubrobacteraceae bacterium]|jgi:hypothetical protein|nr:hypothetical protein [Solirubrobacteraceae bacterium]